ncbi:hypothetical protein AAY473_003399 [Plecturocebus cupreus]
MVDMGFCFPQSLRGGQRAYSKLIKKPVVQPVEKQEPKDPQASKERNTEPPSSEQLEPTVTFLFTLLNTSEPTEPKDPESDSEIQEYLFLDQEDWGPQRTTKEIRHLQNDCMRLRESLKATQAHNLALGEKLQNLPTLLYQSLKEGAQAVQEEAQAIQDEVKALREETQALLKAALLRCVGSPGAGREEAAAPGCSLELSLPAVTHTPRRQISSCCLTCPMATETSVRPGWAPGQRSDTSSGGPSISQLLPRSRQ